MLNNVIIIKGDFMISLSKFSAWLENGLQTMSQEKAYCLNLFDDDDELTCELVGTNKLHKENDNWYFDETKVYGREKPLLICLTDNQNDFKSLMVKFTTLLDKVIRENKTIQNIINKKPFAYGFIDEKLNFIEQNENEL